MTAPSFLDAYDEHVWDVYGYLAYRLASRQDAEDLTQVTFERAYKNWSRFDPSRGSLKTWLLAIARNALADHWRRGQARPEQPVAGIQEGTAPAASTPGPESTGLSPELTAALEALGRRERAVIALRFGGGLNGPEIAELLGITLANAQQIMSRALRRLRTELDRGGAAQQPGEAGD